MVRTAQASADDLVGAAQRETAMSELRRCRVPVSELAGRAGVYCDLTDPAQWAGEPGPYE